MKNQKKSGDGSPGGFSWNLVLRGSQPDEDAMSELRSRVGRIGQLLTRFHPQQVHLLVCLSAGEGNRPPYETKADLKLPFTVLHAQDKGDDLHETIRHSFFLLETQLAPLLEEARGQGRWHKAGGPAAEQTPAFGEPMKKGPQTRADLLRNFILRHYHRLLLHATRRLTGLEAEGAVPPEQIDSQEVLDEVIRTCLEAPERKPVELTYELWLYRLISEELEREVREWSATGQDRAEVPPSEDGTEDFLSMQNAVGAGLEPDEALDLEHFADPSSPSPDLCLEESDLIAEVLMQVETWNRRDREIFNLHFLDGFDAVETAMVEKMEVSDVEQRIAVLHQRLRAILREAGQ